MCKSFKLRSMEVKFEVDVIQLLMEDTYSRPRLKKHAAHKTNFGTESWCFYVSKSVAKSNWPFTKVSRSQQLTFGKERKSLTVPTSVAVNDWPFSKVSRSYRLTQNSGSFWKNIIPYERLFSKKANTRNLQDLEPNKCSFITTFHYKENTAQRRTTPLHQFGNPWIPLLLWIHLLLWVFFRTKETVIGLAKLSCSQDMPSSQKPTYHDRTRDHE